MPNEWQSVLDEIQKSVSDMAFKTYFTHLYLVSNNDGVVTLAVPNVFVRQQIDGKYRKVVERALKLTGVNFKELHVIQKDKEKTTVRPSSGVEITSENPTPVVRVNIPTPTNNKRFKTIDTGLNPKYRLDNYVVGSNNDLAVSAAHAIIENPGQRYNPYFVYGGPGLGKTHLIQAIGNEMHEKYPEKRILYMTIEQFYHDFVEAMRKKLSGFTEKYRKVDVLIVDDFQFIKNKEKSQEEFFHTFNELYNANKQIIISSDRLPSQIGSVEERLASRLMSGVPIDIQMPDFETRCAILKTKAELMGAEIDNKTVEFLAENIRSNIRDLEGHLNQILALAELRGVPTSDLIDDSFIEENSLSSRRKNISPKQLIEKVARFYNLNNKDLLGTSRVKNIKNARQIAMYLMNEELGLSTVRIGSEFQKDHTTIMHGIKVVKNNLKTDFGLREQISELRERIYN